MQAKCKVCEFESELSEDFNRWKATETTPINIYPILPGGNPRKTPYGFICARCLRDARMSRSFIKTVASGIIITKHVLDRYIERCKLAHLDRETAKISLAKEFYYAKKIRFKDKYIAERFLDNGCKVSVSPKTGQVFKVELFSGIVERKAQKGTGNNDTEQAAFYGGI